MAMHALMYTNVSTVFSLQEFIFVFHKLFTKHLCMLLGIYYVTSKLHELTILGEIQSLLNKFQY